MTQTCSGLSYRAITFTPSIKCYDLHFSSDAVLHMVDTKGTWPLKIIDDPTNELYVSRFSVPGQSWLGFLYPFPSATYAEHIHDNT